MNNRNFVSLVLAEGGAIKPLTIPASESAGLGLCNPSVYIDRGEIWLILRNVNYTLYHCENEQTFNNRWGCLSYLNPENDLHLRTTNFLCKLTPDLDIEKHWKIDTSALDKEPIWEFVGLEDARLVRWDGHLYGIGVRRDTTTNGQGRMEFSELELTEDSVKEIGRYRIEHPTDPNWYCEKNWMPILDKPYHFIQWTNPAVVIKADLASLKSSRAVEVNEADKVEGLPFLRGSSQVVSWKNYYICLVHDCDLFKNKIGQKDATYMHRFVVYDRNWRIVKIGDPFSFMDGEIEFCCGMAEYKGDLLISFGFQDNCAFILRVPASMIPKTLGIDKLDSVKRKKWQNTQYPTLEITTAVPAHGCPLSCVFCPQDSLVKSYIGDKMMSYDNFVKVIDKLPWQIHISFAGYCEPYVNRRCTDMILYAHNTGHTVSLFTTGVGMTIEDFEKIKNIPFTGVQGGFVLHLPDVEGYFKHHLSHKYMELMDVIKRNQSQIKNFQSATMGTLAQDLKSLFPNTFRQTMYTRAGNVKRDDLVQIASPAVPTTCGCPERLYHGVLLPNGDMSLCCMDYGLKHIHGNLFTQSYDDVIPEDGTSFELCETCENGVRA
jgi:hypothetical protein